MKRILATVAAVLLTACAAPGGGLKASIFTIPPTYLMEFPLDSITEAQLLEQVGPPDRTVEAAGKRLMVHQMGQGFGVRTYSYQITNGIVTDVIYNDQGPYNGSTARGIQSSAKASK